MYNILIADDEKIIWLEDFRISNECKVANNTTKFLTVTILEEKDE